MDEHEVVSHDEWLEARKQLLAEEKEFTRARDELTQRLRGLPWEAVGKEYVFEGAGGKVTLADVFDGRSQLLVYHFMFDPGDDVGCPICSFWADNFDPVVLHLHARDVTFTAVSQAPFAKIAAYRERMGWIFPGSPPSAATSTSTTAFRSRRSRPTRRSTTTARSPRGTRSAKA